MLTPLWSSWKHTLDSGNARRRRVAIAAPGAIVASAALVAAAVSGTSHAGDVAVVAVFLFALVTVPIGCGSFARRFDRACAEELARREEWNESIEFAGRPITLLLPLRPTIWVATERRLVEARRPRWWRAGEAASPLRTVRYEEMIEIRAEEAGGAGEMPGISIEIRLDSSKLHVLFLSSRGKALLAVLRERTGVVTTTARGSSAAPT